MDSLRNLAVAVALLLAAGCLTFPRPMTRAELQERRTAPALLAYLSQPDASPSVCLASDDAVPSEVDQLGPELLTAYLEGRVAPETFEPCAAALLGRLEGERGRALLERMVRAEGKLIADRLLEGSAELRVRLAALHRTTVDRAPGLSLPPAVLDDAVGPARSRLASAGLGPVARATLAELIEAGELDLGAWRGQAVDSALLDRLAQAAEAELLRRCSLRLPDPALREAAARRLVRLRIAASPFPEVRAAPAAAEEAVLRNGANPVSLADRTVRGARLETALLPRHRVLVRQDLPSQTAKILGTAPDRPEPSVLPDFPLRGLLQVEVAGSPRPITLCADRALDPSPCVAAGDVTLATPFARVGHAGLVQFVERIPAATAVELARGGQLRLPLEIGGRPVDGPSWPAVFERPADLVLPGEHPGHPGPTLEVRVERLGPERLHYTVASSERTWDAVVEWADASSFRVVSRGAPGADGERGRDGADGVSGAEGASASCPSWSAGNGADGGRGEDGGHGQDGGAGGRGGDVRVVVIGPTPLLPETLSLLRTTVASEGGPGGSGGSGGRGGRGGSGGSGGSGTTCTDSRGHTTHLSSGSSGRSGFDGHSGSSGRDGPPGAAGLVRFELLPAEAAASR